MSNFWFDYVKFDFKNPGEVYILFLSQIYHGIYEKMETDKYQLSILYEVAKIRSRFLTENMNYLVTKGIVIHVL